MIVSGGIRDKGLLTAIRDISLTSNFWLRSINGYPYQGKDRNGTRRVLKGGST